MLHELVNYADSHGLGEAGFVSKRIRFLIQFSPKGEYLGLHDYGRSGEEFPSVPNLQFSGDTPKRQFMVDTVDFLTLCPWFFLVFKKAIDKLLNALKKEDDFEEIMSFAESISMLLDERNYSALRQSGSVENWTKILGKGGRETPAIKRFLKAGGEVEKLFNSEEFKLFGAIEKLKRATANLLEDLKQEKDFAEIDSFSRQVMALVAEKKYLEIREKDIKKNWVTLLKRQHRAGRSEIKSFLAKNGPVNAFFNNGEFKRIGKHQFCLRLLHQAAEVEPILGTIVKAMADQSVLRKIHNDLSAAMPAANSTNNATFAIFDKDGLQILAKETSLHDWWKTKQAEFLDNISSKDARCFLSGEKIHPLLTHPKIKGLGGVGGNAETSLISFKEGRPSFQSYGFIQGENAAISVESSVKYAAVVNHLLNHQHQRLAGAEIIYWYSKEVQPEEDIIHAAFSGFGDFEEDDDVEENTVQRQAQAHLDAKEFLKSVAVGERYDLWDVQYCALTLQGNQGRAVVQNWMEGRFADLAANIEQWFSDLEIPRISGIGFAKPPKIETLITCLLKEKKPKQKYPDWIKPVTGFRDAIWRAAVGGRVVPFPENTVRQALLRIRESTLTDEWANAIDSNGEQTGWRRARLYSRIGFIKAYLIRNTKQEITMGNREEMKNSVYWLGSLFAVLADLQRAAHQSDGGKNVKATIVDRFYTTASTCPKLVHGRLIAQSQHHLRKLENKNQNAAFAINREIAAINQKIDFNEVPDILPLPEQSWFALGYYQQIAEMNGRKAAAAANKKDKSKKGEN